MRPPSLACAAAFVFTLAVALPTHAGTLTCPADSVKIGNVCIDKYEASVWLIAPSNLALIKRVQAGKATLADLTSGGATQLSLSNAPEGGSSCTPSFPSNFSNTGNWTPLAGSNPPSPGVYAVSIRGVLPSACITWFQAEQACALSGKRLVTNQEWQRAAAGTPDPGTDNGTTDCAVASPGPVNTGSRSNCMSNWGAFDMVGNAFEWVGKWADSGINAGCTDWTTSGFLPGGDASCFGGSGNEVGEGGGDPSRSIPGALLRGGRWDSGASAGVFNVGSTVFPSAAFSDIGFRCAR